MIIWVMMVLDLLSFGALSLAHFNVIFATYFLVVGGVYLVLKLVLFRDVMSGIDALFGVYMIIVAIFHVSSFVYYLMMGWMFYKLVFTWMK